MDATQLFVTSGPPSAGKSFRTYPTMLGAADWPVRWIQARERGVVGLAPAPPPEPLVFVNGLNLTRPMSTWSPSLLATGASPPIYGSVSSDISVHTVAADLNSRQVSRLIRITKDWSKKAELATETPTDYEVKQGAVLLEPARPSFVSAFTSFLLYGDHHLVPRGNNGEHAWFRAWRLRAARTFLQGATAEAIAASLRHRLAELSSNLVSIRASAPRRLAAQVVRLAHLVAPNAPPAHLSAQVSC